MATIIVIVIVLVVLAAIAAVAGTLVLRRRALRQRFGLEYDQLASQVGERRAQAELAQRRRRVAQLDIRPLSKERRAGYAREWLSLQEGFIDGPAQTAESAAALVSAVAADRGYPADDDDRLLDDLSVYHANRLDGYRRARDTTARASTAGTEDLRQALLGYRALFRDLIGPDDAFGQAAGDTKAGAPGSKQPAAAAARTTRARDDAAGDAGTAGDPAAADDTTTTDGRGTWVDSGRDGRAAAQAAGKD
jgi:hypothetical protein